MKKTFLSVLVILIVAGLGFGLWGYLVAKDVKKQGEEIENLTSDTLNFKAVNLASDDVQLESWKNLSDKAPSILSNIEKYEVLPEGLKEAAVQYYSVQTKDRYKEAEYLDFLNRFQQSLDLKEVEPKSKGQIETIISEYDNLMTRTSNLAIGPSFDSDRLKFEQESLDFKNTLNNINAKMTQESPVTQLRSADLDKTIDEFKQKIASSLNVWVEMQNIIKDEISNMNKANWVIPF